MEVSAQVATTCCASSLFADGSTAHWVGPETLVSLWVEGREINALAYSGSQVNTVTTGYVCQHEFPVLPLHDLVDPPINLIGLGSTRTHPLSFVILQVQVSKITRYDEDVVFLVVPDESEFSRCIPFVIGICTLGWIVNVIKESELDRLSTPWAVVRASCLLSRQGTVVEDQGAARDGPTDKGAIATETSLGLDMDEPIPMKENVRLGPFQTQILECRIKSLIGESTHVMVMPLGQGSPSQFGPAPAPWTACLTCVHKAQNE